jgi:hypothetical protein
MTYVYCVRAFDVRRTYNDLPRRPPGVIRFAIHRDGVLAGGAIRRAPAGIDGGQTRSLLVVSFRSTYTRPCAFLDRCPRHCRRTRTRPSDLPAAPDETNEPAPLGITTQAPPRTTRPHTSRFRVDRRRSPSTVEPITLTMMSERIAIENRATRMRVTNAPTDRRGSRSKTALWPEPASRAV